MFGLKKRAPGRFARRRRDRQDKGRDIVLARRRVLLASSAQVSGGAFSGSGATFATFRKFVSSLIPLRSVSRAGGSLEATRRSFNRDFLLALAADFKKHGAAAIEKVRKQQPAAYMPEAARLVWSALRLVHRRIIGHASYRRSAIRYALMPPAI